MKKLLFIFLFLLMMGKTVHATSWVLLEPKEVVDRAEVIVMGNYDFSRKPKQSEFVFQGQNFHVEKVFKGNAQEWITAGIDPFDVGWAEEFQQSGGEFLLFLEKREEATFLTPVGGPNGMIQIKEGKVIHNVRETAAFYEEFLKKESKEPVPGKGIKSLGSEVNLVSILGGMFILGLIGVGLFRYKRKRQNR